MDIIKYKEQTGKEVPKSSKFTLFADELVMRCVEKDTLD